MYKPPSARGLLSPRSTPRALPRLSPPLGEAPSSLSLPQVDPLEGITRCPKSPSLRSPLSLSNHLLPPSVPSPNPSPLSDPPLPGSSRPSSPWKAVRIGPASSSILLISSRSSGPQELLKRRRRGEPRSRSDPRCDGEWSVGAARGEVVSSGYGSPRRRTRTCRDMGAVRDSTVR